MDDDDRPALRRPSVLAAYYRIYGYRDQEAEEDVDDSPNHDAEVLRDACFDARIWLFDAMCCASGGCAQTEGERGGAENATDETDVDDTVFNMSAELDQEYRCDCSGCACGEGGSSYRGGGSGVGSSCTSTCYDYSYDFWDGHDANDAVPEGATSRTE